MVVLRSSFLFFASCVLLFSSCTNDQLVEVFEQPPLVVSPNHLIGVWELDSVKITTKEHPVEDDLQLPLAAVIRMLVEIRRNNLEQHFSTACTYAAMRAAGQIAGPQPD